MAGAPMALEATAAAAAAAVAAAACCSAVAAIVADVFPILRPPADFFFSGHPNCRLAWLAIMA